jgi:hypothetical protein
MPCATAAGKPTVNPTGNPTGKRARPPGGRPACPRKKSPAPPREPEQHGAWDKLNARQRAAVLAVRAGRPVEQLGLSKRDRGGAAAVLRWLGVAVPPAGPPPPREPEEHPKWAQLNAQQQAAVLDVWRAGRPVTLLGSAGTGKSFVISVLQWLGALVTATTGMAAQGVGGRTLDSLLGFRPDVPLDAWVREKKHYVLSRKLASAARAVLVVDEFSMLGAARAADVSAALQLAVKVMPGTLRMSRAGLDHAAPWGGVRIFLVGDVFQLGPVKDESIFRAPAYTAVFSRSLTTTEPRGATHLLTQNYRQGGHAVFIHLLECVRFAWITPAAWALLILLEERAKTVRGTSATQIFATNRDVDALNERMLAASKLPVAEVQGCWAADRARGAPIEVGKSLTPGGPVLRRIELPASEEDERPPPAAVRVAVGAPMRITRNLAATKTQPAVSNGTIVRVLSIDPDPARHVCVRVLLPCGRERDVFPSTVAERYLHAGLEKPITDQFRQLPLRLAYAATIHSVQGLSMRAVALTMHASFAPWGCLYVALSRAMSMEHVVARGVVVGARRLQWTPEIQRIMDQTGFDVPARRAALLAESGAMLPALPSLLRAQENIEVDRAAWNAMLARLRIVEPSAARLAEARSPWGLVSDAA